MSNVNLKSYLIAKDDLNQRIISIVQGPEFPTIENLKLQFINTYMPGYIHNLKTPTTISGMHEQRKNNEIKYQAEKKLKEKYSGDSLAHFFVDWLIKEHGFKKIYLDSILIPD